MVSTINGRIAEIKRWRVLAITLGALSLIGASACSGSSAPLAASSPVSSTNRSIPTSAATPPVSPPPGGPVPSQLLGDWYQFVQPSTFLAINGYPCPPNPSIKNCFFQLTLTTTTLRISFTGAGIANQTGSQGDVVVNKNEIDFFNGLCAGVGRYNWTLHAGVLQLTLISDPCPRSEVFTLPSWGRTP